jgi:4-diphosphocytidyl-2-C-methyl-D-erythritol kinase
MNPGSSEAPVVLLAPAKLTLSLRIAGVRDDGYHLLDAEMVTLDWHDRLEVEPAPATFVTVVEAGSGLPVPAGPDNLVARALRAAGRTARVTVRKSIPAGAGLGGGSADAAAILRWAGVQDPTVAVTIGADVPFCLLGGRARVRGVGEVLEPLAAPPEVLTLFTPDYGVSTPDVYRAWDDLGGPTGEHGNDLEPAALVVEPRLAGLRDAVAAATGRRPRLAGSGGTWFVEGAHAVGTAAGVVGRVVRTA